MRNQAATALASLLLACSTAALAGPYSPGKGGTNEAAFADAGIPGFVGPDGEGNVTANNSVNPAFVGWATGLALYAPSDVIGTYGPNGIGSQFANPALALGPVTGNNMDVVSLGDMNLAELAAYQANPAAHPPGTLILTFDHPIRNGPGADLAVFENGFVSQYDTGAGTVMGQMFAELGFVEVSTDGNTYARFPSIYLNFTNAIRSTRADSKVDLNGDGTLDSTAYLTQDVSNIRNLAGKHANAYGISWGTPFDLDDLTNHPAVLSGAVNLNAINYVKIVDIPGDGTFTDSQGRPIFDAWVTWGSGGLDVEAVGVLHQVAESPAPTLVQGWMAPPHFIMSVTGLVSNRSYVVQTRTDLASGDWTNVGSFVATQSSATLTNATGGAPRTFYRIGLLP